MEVKTFKKEFVIHTDKTIDKIDFGALPSVGRYFTKPCEKLADGIFKVEIEAPEGDLYYHFRYGENFDNIFLDPNNTQEGAKSWHSICRIGTTSLLPFDFKLSQSFISNLNNHQIEIKAMAHQSWIKRAVLILFFEDMQLITAELELSVCFACDGRKYFKCIIDRAVLADKQFLFKIYGKEKSYYYGKNETFYKNIQDCTAFHFNDLDNILIPAEELNIGPVYHIFPDSFNRSNTYQTVDNFAEWNSIPDGKKFFGGNIEGIYEKLGYIKDMGITFIYMTPIFAASTNDRYNCRTYNSIDPILGTEEIFTKFIQECHRKGLKVIIDIVLNHCGIDFWAFKDVLEKQEHSKYKDWYIIKRYPITFKEFSPDYSCWWNYGIMPQFNLENVEVKNYLFQSCEEWISKFNIDGWRIDVAPELGFEFLREFRTRMKKIKKDIFIIGENWKDSRKFLLGDQLNGVTNYLIWWKAFEPFFVKKSISLSDFANNLMLCYFMYPHNRALENWNVLSSHDVPRFSASLKDKEDIYNAVFMQVFIPGNPVIYYGDEIMTIGADTPDNRRCMNWETVAQQPDILIWYKTLLSIRNKNDVIRRGHFKIDHLAEKKKILIFSRYLDDKKVFFILNFSNSNIRINLKKILKLKCKAIDVLKGRNLNTKSCLITKLRSTIIVLKF